MGTDEEDRSYHFNKRPGKTYIGPRFPTLGGHKLRIASKVIDGEGGLMFATVGDEIVVRAAPSGRFEIVAKVLEDCRKITVLTIQKFYAVSGPSKREYFSFRGTEIDTLLRFIAGIKAVTLEDGNKLQVRDNELRQIVLNEGQARRLFSDNEELLTRFVQSEDLKRDLVAVGYRRKQLEHFERLFDDKEFFEAEAARLSTTPEGVWQQFFEANTWIFGYGLSYQFLSAIDERKLEQIVRGHDIGGSGKRADALMKTQARINSLCFVEIKRHDTPLLAQTPYRPDAWPPSKDLSGGVAQVQATVQGALEDFERKVTINDDVGDPTGEVLFNVQPQSFLLIGRLDEFVVEHGINESKFRSFEMYRRHTRQPSIFTFDELLYRARFIVDHNEMIEAEAVSASSKESGSNTE